MWGAPWGEAQRKRVEALKIKRNTWKAYAFLVRRDWGALWARLSRFSGEAYASSDLMWQWKIFKKTLRIPKTPVSTENKPKTNPTSSSQAATECSPSTATNRSDLLRWQSLSSPGMLRTPSSMVSPSSFLSLQSTRASALHPNFFFYFYQIICAVYSHGQVLNPFFSLTQHLNSLTGS